MIARLLALLMAVALPLADAAAQNAAAGADDVEYKPPMRGAPARRVGGSSRGLAKLPAVAVLAPDHLGLTISEQPSLYWFVSRATAVRIEITLIDAQGLKPLVETSVVKVEPGIHRFSLADFNVRLRPGEEYQWSVSLVPDESQRSTDVVSQGAVKLVAPPPELEPRLAGLAGEARAKALASAGIWYDALAALSEGISGAPADRGLRVKRAALLDQVGLKDAAAFERQAAAR